MVQQNRFLSEMMTMMNGKKTHPPTDDLLYTMRTYNTVLRLVRPEHLSTTRDNEPNENNDDDEPGTVSGAQECIMGVRTAWTKCKDMMVEERGQNGWSDENNMNEANE